MKKRGIGYASTFYGTGYGNGFPDISRAIAELGTDGNIYIYVGATEVGQGAKTILSQIAAEALGVDFSSIVFICEDTSITPDAGTAAASRQTYNTGNAIKLASEKLRNEIINILEKRYGISTENIEDYLLQVAKLNGDEALRMDGIFTASTTEMDAETGQGNPYYPYTFSVYGIEVEVDTTTGIVEVTKAVCGQDVGRAINPKLIEGQIDGGFSMGLGYGIMEDINLQSGRIKHDRFTSYLIPTALDMPDIDKIIIEEPEATGPYGAKGIGEPVLVAVAPAILNAIYNAVGVRMKEIPVTPERLLKALKVKERGV
ncbi:molybdopterin-dependent oxidoreductase [Alkaliphilus pronyensis]|uniref:Molybdopterin-dependent oxidoreductase n=1 Tax=Alkaliphilus pronyensis TaxID=1482732 RepID=A0A6I0F8P5_9FIRM|nr:molybdopterin cofactor-binding domain-containing protein [Alkaliphilus pronyensis]KAB3531648.1 molybdopterin-dependent oxidoreductase [Alkaliphilus pronyensis]